MREVELSGDVHALLDEQALDLLALGAGLDGDERAADHLLGVGVRVVGRLDDLDAAEVGVLLEAALAAAAGVDLRLDDDDRVAGELVQLARGLARLVGGERDAGQRDRDPEAAQQLFPLVLVDLHDAACSFP
jgi:hypothetical protein